MKSFIDKILKEAAGYSRQDVEEYLNNYVARDYDSGTYENHDMSIFNYLFSKNAFKGNGRIFRVVFIPNEYNSNEEIKNYILSRYKGQFQSWAKELNGAEMFADDTEDYYKNQKKVFITQTSEYIDLYKIAMNFHWDIHSSVKIYKEVVAKLNANFEILK